MVKRAVRIGKLSILFALVLAGGEAARTQTANPSQVYVLPTEFWLVVAGACITIGIQMGQLARVRSDSVEISEKVEKKRQEDDVFKGTVNVALAEIRKDLKYLRRRRRGDRIEDADEEGAEA